MYYAIPAMEGTALISLVSGLPLWPPCYL